MHLPQASHTPLTHPPQASHIPNTHLQHTIHLLSTPRLHAIHMPCTCYLYMIHIPSSCHPDMSYQSSIHKLHAIPIQPWPAMCHPHTPTCLPSGVLSILSKMRTRHQVGTLRTSIKLSPSPRAYHSHGDSLPTPHGLTRYSPLQVQPSRVMTCRQIPQGFTFLKVFTLKR